MFEAEVIRRLLATDVGCFSTDQYAEEADKVIARMVGATREACGVPEPGREIRRKQIAGSGLVVEISPDVWVSRKEAP